MLETNSEDLARTVEARFVDLAVPDAVCDDVTACSVIKHDIAASHRWGATGRRRALRDDDHARLRVPDVLWELTRLLLESTPQGVQIHAAAATRGERALVLAGRSHAGKSCARLLAARRKPRRSGG